MESTTPQEPTAETGVIIVDHGSRRSESNEMLLEIVITFRQATQYAIVEPAHMELAEPSIATAFARCVDTVILMAEALDDWAAADISDNPP